MRREYDVCLTIDDRLILKVIIDSHYEKKHGNSISDAIILELVRTLSHKEFDAIDEHERFSYFVEDKISFAGKLYKLIWLFEEHQTYIGIVNAYRR